MKTRYFLILLSFILFSTSAIAQSTDPPAGSGTEADPYLISNLNELYTVSAFSYLYGWDKYYKQTANIDASSTSGWNAGDGFTPIGNSSTKFTGQYDGNYKSISNLYINRSNTNNIGLFGYTDDAVIKNLTLTNVDITGSVYVGAIAGYLGGGQSELLNSSSSGSVKGSYKTGGLVGITNSQVTSSSSSTSVSKTTTGAGEDFGGIVGLLYGGTVSDTDFSGSVSGTTNVGNFVGRNEKGTIEKSYSSGTASGTTSIGGFIGKQEGGTIQNNYATGNATGTTNVGGFIGNIENPSVFYSTLTKNYSTGTATGTTNVGGFLGKKTSGTVTSNYWNTTTSGTATGVGSGSSSGVTGRTTTEMRLTSSFSGFDFTSNWEQISRVHFPVLQDNSPSSLPGMISFAGGDGSSGNPYQISTIIQLHAIRANLYKDYVLINDLDMSTATGDASGDYWNSGEGWEPIGTTFYGDLDGGGYTISGLFVDRTGNGGLFAGTGNGSNIFDLTLEDVDITGTIYVGGLVGLQAGVVTRVKVSGSVSSSNTAGGISGLMTKTLSNSFSSASVSGTSKGGGIAGHVSGGYSASITNCYSTGSISGGNTGGIAGSLANSTKTISTSYATGIVTSNYLNGAGGVVGSNSGVVTNSYWNTTTSGLSNGVGAGSSSGITGLTSSEMRKVSSFSGFDFVNNWQDNAPNAYPSLQNVSQNPLPGYKLLLSNGSVSLDGRNDYTSVAHSENFDNLTQLTLEAWVYFKSSKRMKRMGIIEKHQSPSSGWWVDFNNDLSAVIVTADGTRSVSSNINPELNTWHHVAVTYSGTNLAIYLDGEDVSSANSGTGSGTILNNTRDIRIGDLNWTSANLDGKMDEVRIWNAVRTHDEIRANMFQKLNGDEDDLITYLPFDGVNGTNVSDYSPNEFTVSLEGGATVSSENHPTGTIITGNEGWRIMASPVNGVSYGELLDTLWTQGFTGADKTNGNTNVMVWDESTRTFSSIANATDVPAVGSGFITYVYDDNNYDGTADGFPKMIKTDSTQKTGWVSPTLSFTSTGTLSNDGWNLVGNPYGATIDWDAASGLTSANLDASFYVWSDSANSGAGDYLSWNGSTGTFGGGKIAPWQGFWVKANATSPALTLTDEIRSGGGILLKQAPVSQIGFSLANEAMSSKTIMMFSDNASIEKDGLDAYKLQSLNAEYLSVFTRLNDGSGLDINAIPSSFDENISIDLDLDGSALAGDYELSWNPENLPDGIILTLVDNETGTEIDLTKASFYSFKIQSEANEKSVKTQDITSPLTLASPQHRVISPSVMKAKSKGSRFTIQVNSKTSVSNEQVTDLPQSVELQQNYPNPFNPTTSIAFGIPESGKIRLEVFDVLGRKVATLLNDENKIAGRHSVTFDARNLASGMYIYRLQAGNSIITKKLTLIK